MIPALKKQRQEDCCKFQDSQGHIAKLCFKIKFFLINKKVDKKADTVNVAVEFKIHPETTTTGGTRVSAVLLTTPTQSIRKQSKEGLSILYAFEM